MNKKQLPELRPVPILISSYNRINFLKRTIEAINSTTLYPFYLFVVDNGSVDGSQNYLKSAKVNGKLFDVLLLNENLGQSKSFNELIKYVESWQDKRPMDDWVVFSNEDILPPHLRPQCWLEQMINIFEKYEKNDGLGALSMRIQRMSRADIDETKDIIYWNKGIPAVFRLMRRSDIRQLGDEPMGRLLKWNSNTTADKLKFFLKKRYGFTTHLYGNHIGWCENKGYDKETKTFTVADNKKGEHLQKPYPDIDPETFVPIKINHMCDAPEQTKRDEHKVKMKDKIKKPEVTIIVLTCHRYAGLDRIINSIKKNTNDVDYNLLVMIDKGDTTACNYCFENNIDFILSGIHRDFVAQANIGIHACDTSNFIVLGDDIEVLQGDWLIRALKVFKERFSDDIGLLAFNDGIQNGKLFTMGMSSKKFVEAVGGDLYYRGYVHFGGDREITRLAKEMECYYYDKDIKMVHHHWQSVDTVEEDETYQVSKNKFWRQDQELKKERQGDFDLINKRNYYNFKDI